MRCSCLQIFPNRSISVHWMCNLDHSVKLSNKFCISVSLPFTDRHTPITSQPWNCHAPPSRTDPPLAARWNLIFISFFESHAACIYLCSSRVLRSAHSPRPFYRVGGREPLGVQECVSFSQWLRALARLCGVMSGARVDRGGDYRFTYRRREPSGAHRDRRAQGRDTAGTRAVHKYWACCLPVSQALPSPTHFFRW